IAVDHSVELGGCEIDAWLLDVDPCIEHRDVEPAITPDRIVDQRLAVFRLRDIGKHPQCLPTLVANLRCRAFGCLIRACAANDNGAGLGKTMSQGAPDAA